MPMHSLNEAMRKGIMGGEAPEGVAPGVAAPPEGAGVPGDPLALVDQALQIAGALPEPSEELLGILAKIKEALAPPVSEEAPIDELAGQV